MSVSPLAVLLLPAGHSIWLIVSWFYYNAQLFKSFGIDKALDDIKLTRKDALIVAITRDDEIIIPRGNTVIREGDRVTVFALAKGIEEITQLFTG
ncbi:MAG: hypothetical protein HXS47_02090 [Theionarchaea archaeon]|nr:hypothetical protein [Theionarchaea archaeon]